jgi:hypothetical protein
LQALIVTLWRHDFVASWRRLNVAFFRSIAEQYKNPLTRESGAVRWAFPGAQFIVTHRREDTGKTSIVGMISEAVLM